MCTPVFVAALFIIGKTWNQPKCPTDKWMDREDVLCVYSGLLLCHKNEWYNAIYSNMDIPRDYHIEWNKSDRGRQISYDILYVEFKNRIQVSLFTKQK